VSHVSDSAIYWSKNIPYKVTEDAEKLNFFTSNYHFIQTSIFDISDGSSG
jgi:hypothetical protein